MTNNNKIQKHLNFTCQECHSFFQLVEKHQIRDMSPLGCPSACLSEWKSLLHSHFQDQIILYLAQKEAKNDPSNHEN